MTGLQSWAEVFFIVVLSTTYELRIDLTSLKIEKTQETTMVVADLDGTLLHDGETFEERFLTQRSIDVINRMHDNGVTFVVETARPVSTGFSFVEKLPVDAVAYLNGALIDFNPASSNSHFADAAGRRPSQENRILLTASMRSLQESVE